MVVQLVLQYWPAGGLATGQEDWMGLQEPHGSGLWPSKGPYIWPGFGSGWRIGGGPEWEKREDW